MFKKSCEKPVALLGSWRASICQHWHREQTRCSDIKCTRMARSQVWPAAALPLRVRSRTLGTIAVQGRGGLGVDTISLQAQTFYTGFVWLYEYVGPWVQNKNRTRRCAHFIKALWLSPRGRSFGRRTWLIPFRRA